MRGSARINDVRMAQFVLKIEKLSHIIGARGSQDLRSPSPIMAPGGRKICLHEKRKSVQRQFCDKMHYSALGAMMFIKLLLSLKAREYCVWQNKYFYDLTSPGSLSDLITSTKTNHKPIAAQVFVHVTLFGSNSV